VCTADIGVDAEREDDNSAWVEMDDSLDGGGATGEMIGDTGRYVDDRRDDDCE